MPLIIACFGSGLIFGAGLLVSGMTQPEKVLGFLDIFGAWDATLAFVMAGAVAVSAAGFAAYVIARAGMNVDDSPLAMTFSTTMRRYARSMQP